MCVGGRGFWGGGNCLEPCINLFGLLYLTKNLALRHTDIDLDYSVIKKDIA